MQTLPDYLTYDQNELIKKSKVKLLVVPDSQALHTHFARSIADEISANNAEGRPTRLILPVGPVAQFPILVEICNRERISWKNVFTFNMDEYCDWQGRIVSAEHPLSFRGHIHRNLFDRLDEQLRIPPQQVHFPDPMNLDAISAAIERLGGIDTCYGGVGYHGHVAFNEPPVSRFFKLSADEFRLSLTRILSLAPETIVMNSIRGVGGNSGAVPPMAVTLGMGDIWRSRRIRLYCQGGEWQRTILRHAVCAEQDVDYPVTLLQSHPDYTIITDENTAMPPAAGINV
jgi:glucosamine-6-phosphate deaminase